MDETAELPLKGIKVLEFGHTVMGPVCGLVLADMGADVFKIEKTGSGDDTRQLKGFGSGFFTYLNRNKKSISIDLKSPEGTEIIHALVKQADIIIENFGPGTIERLNLGYATCKELNPRIIFCSLKGFMPGPYEKRPALDEVVQMMGGLAYMTGPSGKPLRAGASVTDIMGGSYGVIGILAALYEREKTGVGKLVQSSLYEAVAFLVGQHIAVEAITGKAPPPMPERGRAWSVYDLFETVEGKQLFIGITSDRHWQRFCQIFEFDDFRGDERLETNQSRIEAREWFLPELSGRIRKMSIEQVMELCEKAHIPFGPVNTPVDLVDDPHMIESGGLIATTTPMGKTARLPKIPVRLEGKSFDLRHHPPAVGQGGRRALEEAGLSKKQIDKLIQSGVIQLDDT